MQSPSPKSTSDLSDPKKRGLRTPTPFVPDREEGSEKDRLRKELGESKGRFELLVRAVEEYAIFMLSPAGYIESWNAGAEKIHGYTADDILGEHFSVFYPQDDVEAERPRHALKTADETGSWVDEGWRVRKGGSRFWAKVTITALYEEDGSLRGFAKITRDMTERRRREVRLKEQKKRAEHEAALSQLLQRVTALANQAISLEPALEQAIVEICTCTRWPVGHVYWIREENKQPLIPSGIWYSQGEQTFEAFRAITEAANFELGESLPGLAASRGEPVWIPDVTEDDSFVRARHNEDIGVRGAFGVPVKDGGETVAVLEFFSADRQEEDQTLLDAIHSVGVQLSRVAERERAHRALRESEQKFRALAEQSLVGVVLIQDGVYRYVNPTFAGLFGYEQKDLLGKSPEVVYHRDDWPRVKQEMRSRIDGEKETSYFVARGKSRSGETVYLQSYGREISYQGRPAIAGASLDVTEQKRLQYEMLQLQEEERRRIGQDLHDLIGSQLTGAALKLDNLSRSIEAQQTKEALSEIIGLIKEGAAEVRRLSHGLSPGGLTEGDLPCTLQALADKTDGARFNNDLEPGQFENTGPETDAQFMCPDEEVSTHLYRIVQEATINARKHAEATEIVIRLYEEDAALVLEVEDDGTGFVPSELGSDEGLGLRSMRHRAELMGANLTVESSPDEGTLITCRMPL